MEDLHLWGYRRYGIYPADCMGGEREKGVVRGVLEDLLPHRTWVGVQEEAWRTCTSGATGGKIGAWQTVWVERERRALLEDLEGCWRTFSPIDVL